MNQFLLWRRCYTDSQGLDETLVCVMSETDRTPKREGDGRGHWGYAYTNFFAGGGVARGRVVGNTDRIAARVHSPAVEFRASRSSQKPAHNHCHAQ